MELSINLCILGYVAIMFQILSGIIGNPVLICMFGGLASVSFILAFYFLNESKGCH